MICKWFDRLEKKYFESRIFTVLSVIFAIVYLNAFCIYALFIQ